MNHIDKTQKETMLQQIKTEITRMQQITEIEALLTSLQEETQKEQKQKEKVWTFQTISRSKVEEGDKEYPPSEEKTDSEADKSRSTPKDTETR